MKVNSIRFKIFVIYIGIISACLIAYRSVVYLNLRHNLFKEVDAKLLTKAGQLSNTVKYYTEALGDDENSFNFSVKRVILFESEHRREDQIRELEFQWAIQVSKFELDKDYINFINPQGQSIVASNNLTAKILNKFMSESKLPSGKEAFESLHFKEGNLNVRLVTIPFSYKNYQNYMLQIATSIDPQIAILKQQLAYNAVIIPIIILIALLGAWVIVKQILTPVKEIARAAKNISLENLGARVKIGHADEEMKYLADAFNAMIERLEEHFRYMTQFSAYVSHELKTPLAIIKGESEFALRKERELEEYKRVIKVNLEESERMLKLVSGLLLLAKLDYRAEVIKFEKIDLAELLSEIHEETRLLAFSKDIRVDFNLPGQQMRVNGNKLHLRRLFLNLVDNAIKFTPPNGRVSISTKVEGDKVIISVSDTGVGILEQDLPKLFKGFFTADNQEQSEIIHGLGLQIVQHILKIHHGNITVKSEINKGSTFTVILPIF